MKRIIIMLLALLTTSSIAQTKNVPLEGVVKHDKENPLSAISVVVWGTTLGTITDDRGIFILAIKGNHATLESLRTGYDFKTLHVEKENGKFNNGSKGPVPGSV